jgi:hypothetical protein
MATNSPATPDQIALARALVSLKGIIVGLDAYLLNNANNLDDPEPLRQAVAALDAARDDLALTAIVIGLDAKQKDFDDLSTASAMLKGKLDQIDQAVAAIKEVVAIASAALAIVGSLVPAIDPMALEAAIKQARAAVTAA